MSVNEYRIGEFLIREGEYPDKFMVVASGQCKAFVEKQVERSMEPSNMQKGRVRKQRRLDFAGSQLQSLNEVKQLHKEEAPEKYMEGYINSLDEGTNGIVRPKRFFENEQVPLNNTSCPSRIVFFNKHVLILLLISYFCTP